MVMNNIIPKKFVKLKKVDGHDIYITPGNSFFYAMSHEHNLIAECMSPELAIKKLLIWIETSGHIFKEIKTKLDSQGINKAFFVYCKEGRFKKKNDKTK